MKLFGQTKVVLIFIFVSFKSFGLIVPLDSITIWGSNIEKIRNAFNEETSALDSYFEEDYYIHISYNMPDSVIHGVALGDFKSKRKLIQFEISKNGIIVYRITSKCVLKNYMKIINIFEESTVDLRAQNYPGFNVHVTKFKDTDRWNYLSYTVKNQQPILKYQFLSSQRNYSDYLMFEKSPNLIEKLTFYGIFLTDPLIHIKN